MGGVATTLIDKNTTIPTSRSQIFSTAADSQTSVEVHVVQGERAMASDNKSLGKFILDGIPPAPRGMPQVEVTFDVDANGILNVKAKEKATGKEQSITIQGSSGLSKDDIAKMQKEAAAHEAEDKLKRETVEAKNIAEQLIYTAEKSIKDAGDKISAEIKTGVEAKVTALRGVKDGTDTVVIKKATEELSTEMQKIGEAMMKAQQAADAQKKTEPPPSGASSEPKKDDKGPEGPVRDAETK